LDDVAPEQQSPRPLIEEDAEEVDYPPDPDETLAVKTPIDAAADTFEAPPRTLRLRVGKLDLFSTILLTAMLLYLASATEWPHRLFGFLRDVCVGETCGPVPFGVDMYIYPVTWGGIGAALAAAGIGPFVSLLKGWYMSFWPVLSLGIVVVSSVAGSVLTVFSARYWV
jgi:hypothetical protein